MRLELLHRRHSSVLSARLLLGHGWKLGVGVTILVVVATSRSVAPPLLHPSSKVLAASSGPTSIQSCQIGGDQTIVWNASGSPYILPWNDPKILPSDTTRQPNCTTPDANGNPVPDDVHLLPGTKLVIDGRLGPVRIFSHGAGLSADGSEIRTINTDQTNFVAFDAEPDVASWDGIAIHTTDAAHVGDGAFSFVSIQHALTAISIDSGALQTFDPTIRDTDPNYPVYLPYGLAVVNSGIGPSYFDGIDSKNTPVSVTGLHDGQYGTVNNIGSQGINVTFDNAPAIGKDVVNVTGITFGSSVPFGETGCPPEPTQCANRVVGSIGNNAVVVNLPGPPAPSITKPVVIDQSDFFRAGSFGVDLVNAYKPQITNNDFVCNGSGSPTPVTSCAANGTLQKFSAIALDNVTADLPDTTTAPPSSPSTLGVSNNVGMENGLDAVVISGKVTSPEVTWMTPTNDPLPPTLTHGPHYLGYMVANVSGTGGIELLGGNLKVADGSVVKAYGGGITLTGGSVDASGSQSKTFTSMRDNTIGIQACPSVFVQSCLPVLTPNEWLGIDLSRATGNFNSAYILFATKGVYATGPTASWPTSPGYSLLITNSRIGPTFSDSVATSGVSTYVASTQFCRVDEATLLADGKTPNQNYLKCLSPTPGDHGISFGPGDHGINADFAGVSGQLTLINNFVQGSTNDGILGTGLSSSATVFATVDIESNTVDRAGAYGLRLVGAHAPRLFNNTISNSGTGPTAYPAMLLSAITGADFEKPTQLSMSCTCISWNYGFKNGLDAIAFDGSTAGDLDWLSPANVMASARLGYLLDDGLTVNGKLTLNQNDLVEIGHGAITVNGQLSATGATVTSLKEGAAALPTCGSIFVPPVSCQAKPGDWDGFRLNESQSHSLVGSTIRYAGIGIQIANAGTGSLSLTDTKIKEVGDSGIRSRVRVTVSGGEITNSTRSSGNGIWFDHGLSVSGTRITNSGQEAILGTSLTTGPNPVTISGATIDGAGTYGIRLEPAASSLDGSGVTLMNNIVNNAGTAGGGPYPAIYLDGITNGTFLLPTDQASGPSIQGNAGSGNGLDAIAFKGSVAHDLGWITAYKNPSLQALGYLLTGTLDMNGKDLTVMAGDIVKVGNGGTINMNGGRLQADDTGTAGLKVFTSLSDNTAGVRACPSALLAAGCSSASGYWGGINLPLGAGGGRSTGSLANAAIRYAVTGLSIDSAPTTSSGTPIVGLVVSRSSIGPTQLDGIDSTRTAISVTNSTIKNAVHGISADLTHAGIGTSLLFSGNRFMSTSAEAILGQALAGRPVWITDNQVQQAGTYGIRLLNADQLVLRNNNIRSSGVGPPIYPAAYLPGVSANFQTEIRGNVGQGNGINAIVIDGKANGDFPWISPSAGPTTTPPPKLGYMLDGSLAVQAGTFTVNAGDVVKILSGSITINQGPLVSGAGAVFTSFKDNSVAPAVCPSVFISGCTSAAAGDWGGISIHGVNPNGSKSTLTSTTIKFADTAISADAGPFAAGDQAAAGNFRVDISGSTITDARSDGINSLDSPIRVDNTTIGSSTAGKPNIGGRGIVATFLGPANCAPAPPAPTCERLQLTNNHIWWTGTDGIVANGLTGQPIDVENNDVEDAGTYGIRLFGADTKPIILTNHVNSSGAATTAYPAVYLADVNGDFDPPRTPTTPPTTGIFGNTGLNDGLTALVFHGTTAGNLPWITPGNADPTLGFMADGPLTVNGTFATSGVVKAGALSQGVVKVLTGGIKINGALSSTDTLFTSMKDSAGPLSCPSIFVPACPALPLGPSDYWGGINIDANPSAFSGGSITYAATGLTINNSELDVDRAILTNLSGYAIHTTGTGKAVITSSSIHGNGGGILSEGAANTSISSSDIYGNSTPASGTAPAKYDVVATVATQAVGNWWGVYPPAATQYNANGGNYVTVTPSLAQQAPTLLHPPGKIAVSSENTNTTGAPSSTNPYLGKGNLTVKLTFDRAMDTGHALAVTVAGSNNIAHQVTGDWDHGSNITWTGTVFVDSLPAAGYAEGDNKVTVSGGVSNTAETPLAMATETSNTTDTPFTLNFGTAWIAGTGTATNVTRTSATLRDSVNPNGWSDPSLTNSNTDTAVFFQYKLSSVLSWPDPNLLNPSIQFGYQTIGHGNSPVDVSATFPLNSLNPNTAYDYRAVAVDLNGLNALDLTTPQHFKTLTNDLDHFTFDAIPSPQAGKSFDVGVTAYDAFNSPLIGYAGGATLTNNLNPSPTGCAGSCSPNPGALTWDSTTGKGKISGVIAYAAEPNRKFRLTDGSVISDSGLFTVTSVGGTADRLSFLTSPQVLEVNAVSAPMTVVLQDKYSNIFDATVATTVNLTVTPNSAGSFLDSTGTTATTSVQIATNSHSAQFTFKGTAAGAPVLTAQATGLTTSATQTETVAVQLYFKTGPQAGLTVGSASGPITVELEDASGSPVIAQSDIIVTLILPATDPTGHFRNQADSADITQVTISSGSSTATFRYKPAASGSQTITARVGGGIPDAQQTETVS